MRAVWQVSQSSSPHLSLVSAKHGALQLADALRYGVFSQVHTTTTATTGTTRGRSSRRLFYHGGVASTAPPPKRPRLSKGARAALKAAAEAAEAEASAARAALKAAAEAAEAQANAVAELEATTKELHDADMRLEALAKDLHDADTNLEALRVKVQALLDKFADKAATPAVVGASLL